MSAGKLVHRLRLDFDRTERSIAAVRIRRCRERSSVGAPTSTDATPVDHLADCESSDAETAATQTRQWSRCVMEVRQ